MRYAALPLPLLLLALLQQGPAWAAGNGSSGIGNKIRVDGALYARMSPEKVILRNDQILDARTNEALLRLQPITAAELAEKRDELTKASLGKVRGFEFIPASNPERKSWKAYWVLPTGEGRWIQLTPQSRGNGQVTEILGSLFISGGNDKH